MCIMHVANNKVWIAVLNGLEPKFWTDMAPAFFATDTGVEKRRFIVLPVRLKYLAGTMLLCSLIVGGFRSCESPFRWALAIEHSLVGSMLESYWEGAILFENPASERTFISFFGSHWILALVASHSGLARPGSCSKEIEVGDVGVMGDRSTSPTGLRHASYVHFLGCDAKIVAVRT